MVKESTTDMAEQSFDGAADFYLVGFKNFVRANPKSDLFTVKHFHHVEFWCGDAANTAHRFSWGLGMPIFLGSWNVDCFLNFLFTAPYSSSILNLSSTSIPSFSVSGHHSFTASHGVVVHANAAFSVAVSLGAACV